VDVGAADAAVVIVSQACGSFGGNGLDNAPVRDLDINVRLLERLDMREFAPNHVAFRRLLVLAEPSLELVIVRHLCGCWWYREWYRGQEEQ